MENKKESYYEVETFERSFIKIEKELIEGINQTGIKSIPRELLDDMKVSYLVLTSQLLGLRQGFELGLKKKKEARE